MKNVQFEKRVRKRKKIPIFMVLVFIITVMAIITLKTDIFTVKIVEVRGHKILTEDIILDTSRVTSGNNIFKERIHFIEESLMEHPYIKKAVVKRSLPNKIIINIEERKKYAAIPFMENFIIIDNEGCVLETLPTFEDLLLVKGVHFANFSEGDVLNVKNGQQMDTLVDIITEVENLGLSVKEIDLTNTDDIRINITNLLTCKIGNADRLNYRFMVLNSILEDLRMKDINRGVIDISHEGYPSYRPVE